jgi:hypothetical protein
MRPLLAVQGLARRRDMPSASSAALEQADPSPPPTAGRRRVRRRGQQHAPARSEREELKALTATTRDPGLARPARPTFGGASPPKEVLSWGVRSLDSMFFEQALGRTSGARSAVREVHYSY